MFGYARFVTGSNGWVGVALVGMLSDTDHHVTGLVRDPKKAAALVSRGMQPLFSTLDDSSQLRETISEAEAVADLALHHDCS